MTNKKASPQNEKLSHGYYRGFIVYLCPNYVAFNCNGGFMITDEQLMKGLQTCDKCGSIHPSSDLFWNIEWNEHTEKQLVVIDCMDEQGLDAICSHCYDSIFNEAMI